MASRPIEILLIEDSPGDVWLTREILLQGSVPKNITVVTDGEQALNYLYCRGKYKDACRPDLVLLDLNLPRRNGLEVLSEIKHDPALRSITVIVLTTSEAPTDINSAYNLNANCYIVKPLELEAFTLAIKSIEEFWLSMAMLPSTLPPVSEPGSKKQRSDNQENPPATSNGAGLAYAWTVRSRQGSQRPLLSLTCRRRSLQAAARRSSAPASPG